MLRITPCVDCMHVEVCKHKETYHEEVEILLTLQNKFGTSNVVAVCKHRPNASTKEK